jgi:hypothetical protein
MPRKLSGHLSYKQERFPTSGNDRLVDVAPLQAFFIVLHCTFYQAVSILAAFILIVLSGILEKTMC